MRASVLLPLPLGPSTRRRRRGDLPVDAAQNPSLVADHPDAAKFKRRLPGGWVWLVPRQWSTAMTREYQPELARSRLMRQRKTLAKLRHLGANFGQCRGVVLVHDGIAQ